MYSFYLLGFRGSNVPAIDSRMHKNRFLSITFFKLFFYAIPYPNFDYSKSIVREALRSHLIYPIRQSEENP